MPDDELIQIADDDDSDTLAAVAVKRWATVLDALATQ